MVQRGLLGKQTNVPLPHRTRCREHPGGPAAREKKAIVERVQKMYLMSSTGINTATIPHNHSTKQVSFPFLNRETEAQRCQAGLRQLV